MKKIFKLIAIVAVIGFTMNACNKSSGSSSNSSKSSGGGGKTINSPEALKEYLDSQPANSRDNPIKVSMGANELMLPKIRDVLNSTGKYVSLNLTGNTLTTIPKEAFIKCETIVSITIPNGVTKIESVAFALCANLTSVTIPDSVTEIERGAFSGTNLTSVSIPNSVTSIAPYNFDNYSLTSVTFQGVIPKDNLGERYGDDDRIFNGDLKNKYLAGGIGTYTRPSESKTWTKQ